MSAAAFGYMLTLIPAGWLVDKVGIRWLLLVGEVIGGIFVASMFTVTTFTQGLVLMGLAGLGMGCLMPSTTKAVLEWFPLKERATAMGVKQTALNVGGIITATTLPAVALAVGWRYGFLGLGFIAVVIGVVSFMLYKPPPQDVNPVTAKPAVDSEAQVSVREIFRGREIWLVMFAGFFMAFVEFSAMAHFVLYSEEVLLLPVITAGFLLASLEGSGAFGRLLSGLVSDRLWHGKRKGLFILMSGITAAVGLVFVFLGPGSSLGVIVLLCLILGFAGIGWAGLYLTLVGEMAGKKLAGTVTGMAATITIIGSITGPPIFGHLVDITGSYRIAWQLLVLMAVIATALLVFVREGKRRM